MVGTLDINNATLISEVMTFDEMVTLLMDEQGVTYNEAVNILSGGQVGVSQLEDLQQHATYRTFTQQLNVSSIYKPSLKFYCQTSESGSFIGVVKLLNTGMNRSYNGITKQFDGTIYTHLQNANRIFYIVNGDFFNNGTTTVNAGVSIGIGGKNTVDLSVSSSSNYYKYYYGEGTKNVPY